MVRLRRVSLGFGEIVALHTRHKVKKNRKIQQQIVFLMNFTEMTTYAFVQNSVNMILVPSL